MSESKRLFIDLEPPAGGLQRLRQSLCEPEPARRRKAWYPLAAGALAFGLLAVVFLPGLLSRQRGNDALLRALRQAVAPEMPANGLRVIDGAAIELPSGQSDVRLYFVQSTMPPASVVRH